jgi:hypothetical protein
MQLSEFIEATKCNFDGIDRAVGAAMVNNAVAGSTCIRQA